FIHTLGDAIPGSLHIKEDLYWGGDFEVLKRQIKLGLVRSNQVRFFLGYSGWDPGQLEEEIKENSWLVTDLAQADLMTIEENELWVESVRSIGGKYSMWENFPENPSLN
ncbi:MAG: YqgE/AlgH family protein, partial [Bacteroidota bacterium]|nr:YqgE/AlgH family protein [Bacteroidota bacterium]